MSEQSNESVCKGTEFPRRRPQLIKHGAKCMCTLNSRSQPAKVYVKHRGGKFMLASSTIRMAPGHGNCMWLVQYWHPTAIQQNVYTLLLYALCVYIQKIKINTLSGALAPSCCKASTWVLFILPTAQSRSFKSPLWR